MRETLETKVSQAKSLLDVLLILKEVTMRDTHVATLAYLDSNLSSFNGKYGIWNCRPFPLYEGQDEYTIQGYYFSADGDNFTPNTIILIVFTDKNFINNLQVIENKPQQTKDVNLHLLKYGVIVSLPGIELTPAEKQAILDF